MQINSILQVWGWRVWVAWKIPTLLDAGNNIGGIVVIIIIIIKVFI